LMVMHPVASRLSLRRRASTSFAERARRAAPAVPSGRPARRSGRPAQRSGRPARRRSPRPARHSGRAARRRSRRSAQLAPLDATRPARRNPPRSTQLAPLGADRAARRRSRRSTQVAPLDAGRAARPPPAGRHLLIARARCRAAALASEPGRCWAGRGARSAERGAAKVLGPRTTRRARAACAPDLQ